MHPASSLEAHGAIDQGKERVVLADPHVDPTLEARAALADENCAGGDGLTAIALDATELGI